VFVFLSKTLDLLLSPLTWALLFLLPVFWWGRRDARVMLFAGLTFGTLYLSSVPWVAAKVVRLTENGARKTFREDQVYDAAIVLGGAVDAPAGARSGQLELNAAAERVVMAFSLYKSGKVKNLLISGGAVFPRPGIPAEANLVKQQLQAWGVPEEHIFSEPKSRNTRENALESLKIVNEQRWARMVLVTSAAHMPRALGCFQTLGMTLDALPVDHRTVDPSVGVLLPRVQAMGTTVDALRELAGRWVYAVAGYAR